MNTPWGRSDSTIKIQRGVSWVSTPSHGGLAVTATAAVQNLSGKAVNLALEQAHGTALVNLPKSAYIFFEEDCLYAVAFYEHPEWKRALDQNSLDYWRKASEHPASPLSPLTRNKFELEVAKSDEQIKAEMEVIIRRWFPEYFGPIPQSQPLAMVTVRIRRAEGPHALGDNTFRVFDGDDAEARGNAYLREISQTAPKGGAYDKTDVVITFANGQQWDARFDVKHSSEPDNDTDLRRKFTTTIRRKR